MMATALASKVKSLPAGAVRLLLGGRDTKLEGFLNVDLYEGDSVDIRSDASDLGMFEAGSVSEIYASHILEHFPHPKTVSVLREWARVLAPGGKAYISVPDFDALVRIYQKHGLVPYVRNMLHGDQGYDLAFHYTIFTFGTLAKACIDAGFSDVKRLLWMPYNLNDCSSNIDTDFKKPVSVTIEAIR